MNKLFKILTSIVVLAITNTSCGGWDGQGQIEQEPRLAVGTYEDVFGKSINDKAVVEFLFSTSCSQADQFLICKAAGMALWINSNQVVETIYLYLNNEDGFEPYQGELPFGLKFYDTMAAVEYKLNRQGFGNNGLPDKVATPDHMHHRAIYDQAGITVMYNSPFADEDATIYAILVKKQVTITKGLHRIVPSARLSS